MYACYSQEKICEDSSSFDYTSADIASGIRDLADLAEQMAEAVRLEEQGGEAADVNTDASTSKCNIYIYINC